MFHFAIRKSHAPKSFFFAEMSRWLSNAQKILVYEQLNSQKAAKLANLVTFIYFILLRFYEMVIFGIWECHRNERNYCKTTINVITSF